MRLKRFTLLLAGLFCFFCNPAFAHKVNLFCYVEGTTVYGEGYFSGGRPAQSSKIEIYDLSNNNLIAETFTDEEGKFSLELNVISPMKVIMNAGQGHRAEFILKLKENELVVDNLSDAKEIPTKSDSETLMNKKIEFLEERLSKLQKQQSGPHFVSIIAGIGWIIGIFTLIYFLKKKNAF